MILVDDLDKSDIENMVFRFYTKVLRDEKIGPIFKAKLGEDLESKRWKAHLKLIASFWVMIAKNEKGYAGDPLAPHLKLPDLKKEHFVQWIALFGQTTNEMYEPGLAHLFNQRARMIGGNFMRNLRLGEL